MRIAQDHQDRDEIKQRAEADFLNLFDAYGGRRRGKALLCLFHDDKKKPSGSIFRGRFYCFTCGIDLDVIDFVARLERSDFKSALSSLADRYRVPLNRPMTQAEKREYARRKAAAEVEGAALVEWKSGMLAALRETRDLYFHGFHRYFIAVHSLDHPHAEFFADAADCYRDRYEDLDTHIERIQRAAYAELAPFFRARRRRAA